MKPFHLRNTFILRVGDNEENGYQSKSPSGKLKLLSVLFSMRGKVEVWGSRSFSPQEGG